MNNIDTTQMTRPQKIELASLLAERANRDAGRKLQTFFPNTGKFSRDKYAKHVEFFTAGAQFKQRLFMAANRVGKTNAGAFEVACHLTGHYPEWWQGKRFDSAVEVWVAGKDSKTTRDTVQKELLGKPGEIGTGMIARDNIVRLTKAMGTNDYYDTVTVKHSTGHMSTVSFKSYDQGRKSFEGTAKHVIWLDEECPEDVYYECFMRTMTTQGIVLLTFTPMMGTTKIVQSFQEKTDPSKSVTQATWDDVPHFTQQEKKEMFDALPPHQRDARSKGIPSLGSGAIYPVNEERFLVEPFKIPKHYKHSYALDVGWNRTAVLWCAIDPDTGVKYIYSEYYVGEEQPIVHSAAIKTRGDWIPGCIDPAARGRGQDDGRRLLDQYKEQGLKLRTADNAVESGIYGTWEKLSTGQIKVFDSCVNFLKEFRLYQRDKHGKVVKENDHLMDCLRYLNNTGFDLATQKPVAVNTANYNVSNKPFRI
jgi:phage terminase large subunit-like protein